MVDHWRAIPSSSDERRARRGRPSEGSSAARARPSKASLRRVGGPETDKTSNFMASNDRDDPGAATSPNGDDRRPASGDLKPRRSRSEASGEVARARRNHDPHRVDQLSSVADEVTPAVARRSRPRGILRGQRANGEGRVRAPGRNLTAQNVNHAPADQNPVESVRNIAEGPPTAVAKGHLS